jgi:fructoselysine and glucoselysine-specific PTS system IIA component
VKEVKQMERKIILASHGKFASGILDSMELIYGKTTIIALDCYTTPAFDLAQTVEQMMEQYKEQELIIITDIFGGSVNNEFLRYIHQPNLYLIAGLNLPFLIELAAQIETADSIEQTIQQTLINSKQTIQFCNESVHKKVEEEEF